MSKLRTTAEQRTTPAATAGRIRAMVHCTCRIDSHCLKWLLRLEVNARCQTLEPAQILRQLNQIQGCPCYFASHCIETLCGLIADLEVVQADPRELTS